MARASQRQGEQSPPPAIGQPVMVLDHGKRDGGKGITHGTGIESAAAKNFEAGYIDPMERSNPTYLRGLKEKQVAEERKKREAALKNAGVGFVRNVIGLSPNSPLGKEQRIF